MPGRVLVVTGADRVDRGLRDLGRAVGVGEALAEVHRAGARPRAPTSRRRSSCRSPASREVRYGRSVAGHWAGAVPVPRIRATAIQIRRQPNVVSPRNRNATTVKTENGTRSVKIQRRMPPTKTPMTIVPSEPQPRAVVAGVDARDQRADDPADRERPEHGEEPRRGPCCRSCAGPCPNTMNTAMQTVSMTGADAAVPERCASAVESRAQPTPPTTCLGGYFANVRMWLTIPRWNASRYASLRTM